MSDSKTCRVSGCARTLLPVGRCPDHGLKTWPWQWLAAPEDREPTISFATNFVQGFPETVYDVEEWRLDGEFHRVGAPSAIWRDSDRRVEREVYHLHGRRHRLDGPAFVLYEEDGSLAATWWSFLDKKISGPADIAAELRRRPKSRSYLIAASPYRDLAREHGEGALLRALEGGVCTLDGIREVISGAPVEWVGAFEGGISS